MRSLAAFRWSFLATTLAALGCASQGSKGPVAITTAASLRSGGAAPYASPMMGAGGYGYAFGSATPSAEVPNGMARFAPETSGPYGTVSFLHFDGYWAGDNTILAFSHLHLHGTGSQDYGVLGVMPVAALQSGKTQAGDYASTFAKSSEIAWPGYYAVTLDNGGIKAEATATTHASLERYTFGKSAKSGTLIVDLNHRVCDQNDVSTDTTGSITLVPEQNEIQGDFQTHNGMSGGFHLYFVARFDKAWTGQHVWADGIAPSNASTLSGTGVGSAFDFDVSDGNPIELQVGLSMVSSAGAAANLGAELNTWDFDTVHNAAVAAWNRQLSAITVHATPGVDDTSLNTFYSALHHAFVMPGDYSDTDGSFNYSGSIQKMSGHFMTDISGWDVYRSLFPLYTLIAPDVAQNVAQSLYLMAAIGANYPKWPMATGDAGAMIGSPPDVMISEAYVKGLTGFDAVDAYRRLRDAALLQNLPEGEGRGGRGGGFPDYLQNGYLLPGDGSVVSETCEYNQDDFALANFAKALGYTDDAAVLLQRSSGFEHLYDPATGFLRARNADGSLANDGFTPNNFGFSAEYVEADAYQSQFCPQWNAAGLAKVWGGNAKLAAGLEQLFESSQQEHTADVAAAQAAPANEDPNEYAINLPPTYYFAGNEPDIHYPFLFAQIGRPDLTDKWSVWGRNNFFSATPTGLPGNDDGGTMAAWYVWSALGLYPIPGSDQYVIGSPLFSRTDIQVAGGVFSIVANGVSPANIYVQSAVLNGQPLNTAVIHHSDLKTGGSLVLTMGPNPSTWAQSN